MATATVKRRVRRRPFGPECNGLLMTPDEFDRGEFAEGWRYELVNGVLIVSPSPLPNERNPNDYLGHLLFSYQESHPQGASLDVTLPEHDVSTGPNRRRADRVIWAGLGRLPTVNEPPAIVVEFVSAGRRNWLRDYEAKRDEYLAIGVKEYWVIDRFAHTLTVFDLRGRRVRQRVVRADQKYKTSWLPGFELPLDRLFALADQWRGEGPSTPGEVEKPSPPG